MLMSPPAFTFGAAPMLSATVPVPWDSVVRLDTATRPPLCDVVRESASVFSDAVTLMPPLTLMSDELEAKLRVRLAVVVAMTVPPLTDTAPPETDDSVPSEIERVSARTLRLLAAGVVPSPTSPLNVTVVLPSAVGFALPLLTAAMPADRFDSVANA